MRRFGVLLLSLVSMVAVSGFAAPGVAMAASPTTTNTITVETNKGSLPAWIIKADPYVHVVNGVATIDRAASRALDANTYSTTLTAVNRFNTLPMAARLGPISLKVVVKPGAGLAPSISAGVVQPMMINLAACATGSYNSFEWWGVHVKLSECLTRYLGSSLLAFGGIVGIVAVIPPADLLIGAVAVILVAVDPILGWVDQTFCDNHGVAINLVTVPLFPSNIGC